MHATLSDISKRTGFSTATVSRVMNGSPLVNEFTRRRVQRAVRDLGYTPSHSARALKLQRTSMLGVTLPKVAAGYFAEIVSGIDEVAAAKGFHLVTILTHGEADEQEMVLRVVRERRVDALIVFNMRLADEVAKEAARRELPLALIGRAIKEVSSPTATVDNAVAAELAMTHLLSHGYRDVAVLAAPRDNRDSEERLAGCRKAMARAGEPLDRDRIWRGQFTEESGREAIERWLDAGHRPPRAIFALNDDMALGAMNALRARGFRVPDDVAVLGFDDAPGARYAGLSTVRVPMAELGRRAARAALQQVLGGPREALEPVRGELVMRTSCGCNQGEP